MNNRGFWEPFGKNNRRICIKFPSVFCWAYSFPFPFTNILLQSTIKQLRWLVLKDSWSSPRSSTCLFQVLCGLINLCFCSTLRSLKERWCRVVFPPSFHYWPSKLLGNAIWNAQVGQPLAKTSICGIFLSPLKAFSKGRKEEGRWEGCLTKGTSNPGNLSKEVSLYCPFCWPILVPVNFFCLLDRHYGIHNRFEQNKYQQNLVRKIDVQGLLVCCVVWLFL